GSRSSQNPIPAGKWRRRRDVVIVNLRRMYWNDLGQQHPFIQQLAESTLSCLDVIARGHRSWGRSDKTECAGDKTHLRRRRNVQKRHDQHQRNRNELQEERGHRCRLGSCTATRFEKSFLEHGFSSCPIASMQTRPAKYLLAANRHRRSHGRDHLQKNKKAAVTAAFRNNVMTLGVAISE